MSYVTTPWSNTAGICSFCGIEFTKGDTILSHPRTPTIRNIHRIHIDCLNELLALGRRKCSFCDTPVTSINGIPVPPVPQAITTANAQRYPIHSQVAPTEQNPFALPSPDGEMRTFRIPGSAALVQGFHNPEIPMDNTRRRAQAPRAASGANENFRQNSTRARECQAIIKAITGIVLVAGVLIAGFYLNNQNLNR